MESAKKANQLDTSVALQRQLWDQFKSFCWANDRPAKRVLEGLVRDFLQRQGVEVEESNRARTPTRQSINKAAGA